MKGKILNILRDEKEVVSGEILSDRLGISRVSVWKHINKLRAVGYPIEATSRGYRMIGTPDLLYPWEFGERESKIHYFDTVDSTMDVARELARKHCPHFTVVVAGRQTKGRGRLHRTWISSDGGLYFTMVLRPKIPPALSSRVSFAASAILARTLRKMFEVDARVKWPNDILIDGRKVSGLLSEIEAETDRVRFISVGLGINVNNDPMDVEPMATSLTKILGRKISRKFLLSEFLDGFERRLNRGALERAVSEWKEYAETLNRHVRIVTEREISEGFAMDVDEDGALILKLADGSLKKILHGDCFHQKKEMMAP